MNTSIKIICKKTPLKNGLFPIYLRITINRKSKFYSTPFTCNLSEWNDKLGEFKSKYRNSNQSNKALRKIKDDAADVVIQLEKEYKSYNLILFDKYYSRKYDENISFIELCKKEMINFENNSQINYARSMGNTITALQKFDKKIHGYSFENIDFQFLTNFENFLRKRGANDGGIAVYMRNIRTIYNKAINYKIVQPQYYCLKRKNLDRFF